MKSQHERDRKTFQNGVPEGPPGTEGKKIFFVFWVVRWPLGRQDTPRGTQEAPKTPSRGPKTPQEAPRRAPRGPQDGPRRPKRAPRGPRGEPEEAKNIDFPMVFPQTAVLTGCCCGRSLFRPRGYHHERSSTKFCVFGRFA